MERDKKGGRQIIMCKSDWTSKAWSFIVAGTISVQWGMDMTNQHFCFLFCKVMRKLTTFLWRFISFISSYTFAQHITMRLDWQSRSHTYTHRLERSITCGAFNTRSVTLREASEVLCCTMFGTWSQQYQRMSDNWPQAESPWRGSGVKRAPRNIIGHNILNNHKCNHFMNWAVKLNRNEMNKPGVWVELWP